MPGLKFIGGAHMRPVKPLPEDIKEFLDGTTNGVIVFSLGTVVKTSDMPKHKLDAFLSE